MKVLQINSVCGIGSTGRIATDIHNILNEQGHESYLSYGRDLPKNCDNAIRIGNKIDNYMHVAKTRIFDKHGFGSNKATEEFIEKVAKIAPDIIHLHNIHGYYLNIEILFNYLKSANKPVVWTLHDCWTFTGHCAYFDYARCDKWKTECYDCTQVKDYPSSALFDNSKANYNNKKQLFTGIDNMTIVTPSKWLAGLIKKSFLGGYPVRIINNGIDLETFKPTKSNFRELNGLNDKFIILGVASNWDKRKGLKHFLQLSKSLANDEVIILIGLTKKQQDNLPQNIIGITKTNNINELVEAYSAADVFANLTLEDNFPTTNLESLACGTPVITFNTGGSPECVDDKTGMVSNKGEMEKLINNIKIIKNMGKSTYSINCLERARRLYNKQNNFNEYIDLYKQIGCLTWKSSII